MTKENIFKSYLEDPLLFEKKYITLERAANLKLIEPSNVKLIEIIKIAIIGNIDGETEGITSRKINQYLNK
jgi:hypothetical protein